ncbi:type III secretion system protein PrgR [Enterococcus sp. DIV0660C]|uniref:type III secretion system protein PrgR n=1 Tax=Enterococcus sp. DIV0660C TaxID=2230880 RepID=UPI001A905429|nr:type III secretion system protein PrgR [Enterococcus sp. DIV0660C]MBO0431298.1 type III secretion system protein PrgR [Enterococcus sp. DIV0660C]
MELKPMDLKRITCEFVLFNRQHVKYSNQTVKRIVVDYSGKVTVISTKEITNNHELKKFFDQIKSIYVDGKTVACRGCSDLPLQISNHDFAKLKKRKLLLVESEKSYRKLEQKELYNWNKDMIQHIKKVVS